MEVPWRMVLQRSDWEGYWHVQLYGSDDDILLSGTVRCYDGESFAFWLEEHPPTLSDAVGLRVLVAIFEFLEEREEVFDEAVNESVELEAWLKAELSPRHAQTAWAALNEAAVSPVPPEAPADLWWFSWQWLEERGPEWRAAQLRLWRGTGSATAEVEGVGRIGPDGEVVVTQVIADDLLLPEVEMAWLLTRLVQRFWRDEGVQEHGRKGKVEYLPQWLSRRRGKRGQWVWNLMNQAIRTFGNIPV